MTNYTLPQSIDGVLQALDEIIEESVRDNNYLGLFAYVYRRTTAEIKSEILKGSFDDNPGMERFDVRFANYYLEAYYQFRNGEQASLPWQTAFDSKDRPLAYLQHILLGMNAHINLDLGVTAAVHSSGQDIEAISRDFHKINDILARLTREMQARLGKVSPLMFLLDWMGRRTDEKLINFSIKAAREFAWANAKALWTLQDEAQTSHRKNLETVVDGLSETITSPRSRVLRTVLWLIRNTEGKDMTRVLAVLSR